MLPVYLLFARGRAPSWRRGQWLSRRSARGRLAKWAAAEAVAVVAALAAVAVVSWLASQLRRRRPQGHSQLRLLRYRQLMLYQHWRLRLRFQWLLTFSRTRMGAKKVQQA